MTARLALMRHAPTAWNRARRIQGRTDIPLDDGARQDLERLSLPPPWDRATLWSSPLSRARETARRVARREPCLSDALIEMDWGAWEGRHGTDLRSDPESGYRDIEAWGWHFTPPGGESPEAVRSRLEPWLDALTGDNIAICHIGIMRVILAMAWGWDFAGPCPFAIKRNRLYLLERASGTWCPRSDAVRLTQVAQ